jgi:hypothetical protein
VPLIPVLKSLPGSTAVDSGTLEVVLGPSTILVNSEFPGLAGSTYVIVSAQTSVPVVLRDPTSGVESESGKNGAVTLQASAGAVSSRSIKRGVILLVGSLIALLVS